MGSIAVGGHLEISRINTREAVLGTCIGKFRRDGRRWYVVSIEWASGLAFSMLGFNLGGRSDTRHVSHPWECHSSRHNHDG